VTDFKMSLDEFVEQRTSRRSTAWADGLPEEVQDIIRASTHPTAAVVDWLLSEGFEGASYSKVDVWRRKQRGGSLEP